MNEVRVQRRLAAILAADVAGYSRMMGRDEAGTLAALREIWANRFNPAVAAHQGRIVKMMGDGALVEFGSAVDAVDCAVAVQAAMAAHNAERPDAEPVLFRIGVNLGDIIIEGDDILGDGVNVAARLETAAPRGGILVSEAVHAQVRGKVGIVFAPAGALALKNIALPVTAWRWGEGEVAAQAAVPRDDGPSVAVLPFTNMSNDPEQEYFSDGISEDIITDLSKVAGLMVVARNSSFAYKGRTSDLRVVGRELGVRSLLEGSIRRVGNRVRIAAQLIDAATGAHLWAERYDRELTDIFAVQDEVTLKIVGALRVTLQPAERALVVGGGTANVAAHDALLRARQFSDGMLKASGGGAGENLLRVISLLEEAIRFDPDYAQAYGYLAMAYMVEYSNRWTKIADPLELALHFSAIALDKDPNEALAYSANAVALTYKRDLDGAKAQVLEALRLNPNFSQAYATKGNIEIFLGHPDAAILILERAIRLDPVYAHLYTHFIGLAHLQAGRFALAAETFRARIRLSPNTDLSRGLLVSALGHLGEVDAAARVWTELKALNPQYSARDHIARLPFRDPADPARIAEGLALAGVAD